MSFGAKRKVSEYPASSIVSLSSPNSSPSSSTPASRWPSERRGGSHVFIDTSTRCCSTSQSPSQTTGSISPSSSVASWNGSHPRIAPAQRRHAAAREEGGVRLRVAGALRKAGVVEHLAHLRRRHERVVGLLRAAHDRLALRVDLLALHEELGLELRHPLVLRLASSSCCWWSASSARMRRRKAEAPSGMVQRWRDEAATKVEAGGRACGRARTSSPDASPRRESPASSDSRGRARCAARRPLSSVSRLSADALVKGSRADDGALARRSALKLCHP